MFELGTYYSFEDLNDAIVDEMHRLKNGGHPANVLDVGCGRARLGQEIERLGFAVTGLESDAIACRKARTRISEVIEIDLRRDELVDRALAGRKFDCLLFADVLEHISDPLSVLRRYRQFLADGGKLVVSLPNVAVWDNRLKLLAGSFNYRDSGVMDRTHLRFSPSAPPESSCVRQGLPLCGQHWSRA